MKLVQSDPLRVLKGVIYRIHNKSNGRSYIGKAIKSFYHRYRRGEWWNSSHCQEIKDDFVRFGKESFEVTILESGYSDDTLCKLESEFIIKYDSLHPNGYNLVTGGSARRQPSAITRQRMSAALKKRRSHPDYVNPDRWKDPFQRERQRLIMTGRKTSKETIDKQSLSGKKRTDSFKAVLQIDNSTHKVITSFRSIKTASQATGVLSCDISYCASSGHLITAGGYIWRYVDNPSIPPKLKKGGPKKVSQIDSSTKKKLNTFCSARQAALSINGNRSKILEVCRGNRITHKGFEWQFTHETT